MPCLIVDTSTDVLLLALLDGEHLHQKILSHGNALSKLLLPEIQAFLKKHTLKPSDLSAIALGIGPGSYTGTRVGAAVGKSLAFGLKLPLKTFPSPLAFLPKQEGRFAFTIAARSGAFFVLKGILSATKLVQESAKLVPLEELPQCIRDADFVVSASSNEAFSKKPIFAPQPNFQALSLFLPHTPPTAPENAGLLYLHNPF